VVPDQRHRPVAVDRPDGARPRVLDHVPLRQVPLGHLDPVGPQGDKDTAEIARVAHYLPLLIDVLQPRPGPAPGLLPGPRVSGPRVSGSGVPGHTLLAAGHALAAARRTLPAPVVRAARECSSAAATTPWNAGCGRVGRDRNSRSEEHTSE